MIDLDAKHAALIAQIAALVATVAVPEVDCQFFAREFVISIVIKPQVKAIERLLDADKIEEARAMIDGLPDCGDKAYLGGFLAGSSP